MKRLDEYGGDIRKFKIVKRHPSVLKQIGVSKTEPGDENNQDISALVGKVDIRKLETFSQDDPDAYSFSGGLCLANQGLLEFVEMFKAPIKVLHPLLTATQEGNFKGTEGFGAIPFDGIVLAHSNESEWKTFRNNKNNEAFLDRIYIVKIPYCLRTSEEVKIYEKLLRNSSLADAKCAPGTLKMMSQFAMLTRLKEPENSSLYSKMLIYDGDNLKDTDPRAKSYQEYRDYAGVDEGMSGVSTRFAFKILSKVFNFDPAEVAANPVHLMYVLEQQIEREQFPAELEQKYLGFIKEHLSARYAEFIGKEIQTAYLESYSEYGQNIFDRYVTYADYWIQDQEYRDTDTGEVFDRSQLNAELEKIEKPAGISNPKDFRNEIVNFVLRARANNNGKNPLWTSYEKLRTVIEKKMFSNTEELLPVISFNAKASADEAKKHENFVNRMVEKGYTPKQVRLLCEWYLRVRKSLAREAHAPADHRSPARGQEQVDRQSRALPAPLSGTGARRGPPRGRQARHPRDRAGRGHPPARSATSASRRSATAAAGRARSCIRQQGVRARRPHRAAAGRLGPRQRPGPGGRFRRGRGRFRLPPHQGRVHADLLRRPGPAAPGAQPARRDAGDEEPARRLLEHAARRAT